MPELPEVETVASELRPLLVGRRFVSARVLWPRTIAQPDLPDFVSRLAGQTVIHVSRRGKYVLCLLDSGDVLAIHLRMTGQLNVVPDGDLALDGSHIRAYFVLEGGGYLVFTDVRKFGRIWLSSEPDQFLRGLGPEPLAWDFTPESLAERLRPRRGAIKSLLLNQAVVAGLGNIYADEALFLAAIHPLRAGASLTDAEIDRLHAAIRLTLHAAIGQGGTTLRDYRPPYSGQGAYQHQLRVYQQTGQPCARCGTPIQRIRVTQRSTHFCPQCQPDPHA